MKVAVSGATGFIGKHVVSRLLEHGHEVIAVCRDKSRAKSMSWFDKVEFVFCDLYLEPEHLISSIDCPDAFLHLAWPGLPN